MEIINIFNLEEVDLGYDLCATIGNFDGVHLGHQELISKCLESNLKSAVITFSVHPDSLLVDNDEHEFITTNEDKINIIKEFNVDFLIMVSFDNNTLEKSKDDFISFLKKMRIKKVICGDDFRFGYKGLGNHLDLTKNFDTLVMPKYKIDNHRVSSTLIKEVIKSGDVSYASKLLGRYYSITGLVVHGNKIGSTLGFRTANIDYTNYILPINGVYFVHVYLDDKKYYGALSVGNNPTCNYSDKKSVEVYILDFDKVIYEKTIKVLFIDRIRSEIKFESKDDLIKQINNDIKLIKDKIK